MHKPHLEQAWLYWQELLQPTDTVIDATCGNGKDAARLAALVPQGHVYALDIQSSALDSARRHASSANVSFLLQSHTLLPSHAFKLIVYNLGYLPGGDKRITTRAKTTLQSVQLATERIMTGGALSITCYPRHPEGEIEEKILHNWTRELDPTLWQVNYHVWKEKCPTLFYILKLK